MGKAGTDVPVSLASLRLRLLLLPKPSFLWLFQSHSSVEQSGFGVGLDDEPASRQGIDAKALVAEPLLPDELKLRLHGEAGELLAGDVDRGKRVAFPAETAAGKARIMREIANMIFRIIAFVSGMVSGCSRGRGAGDSRCVPTRGNRSSRNLRRSLPRPSLS